MRKNKYSKEFKDSTVQLILNNNANVVKVAQDLDLRVPLKTTPTNLKVQFR